MHIKGQTIRGEFIISRNHGFRNRHFGNSDFGIKATQVSQVNDETENVPNK